MQDATLSQNSQIGLAFRNAALRRVLVILLAISALGLAALNCRETRDYGRRENVWLRALTLAAQIILGLFVIDVALVVFAGINPLIASAQGVLLEYAALIAVIVITAPWQRVRLYRTTFVRFAPALLIAAAVLILWEVLINAFNIKQFLLPRPSVILTTFLNVYPKLVSAGWYTFQNALWGYLIGCGLGIRGRAAVGALYQFQPGGAALRHRCQLGADHRFCADYEFLVRDFESALESVDCGRDHVLSDDDQYGTRPHVRR